MQAVDPLNTHRNRGLKAMTETQEFQEIGKRLEDLREHISIIKREVAQIERHLGEGINHLAAIVRAAWNPNEPLGHF
jgi:tetrahydromethanopterin S-methyltransferase subunit G